MDKKIRRTFILIMIIGILGGVAIGLIGRFVFEFDDVLVVSIIGNGATLAGGAGIMYLAATKAMVKKEKS